MKEGDNCRRDFKNSMTTNNTDISSQVSEEVIDTLCEIAEILGTGLDRRATKALVQLLEAEIRPESLAAAVTEVRRTTSRVSPSNETFQTVKDE
jgi:hypothetical protein